MLGCLFGEATRVPQGETDRPQSRSAHISRDIPSLEAYTPFRAFGFPSPPERSLHTQARP